MTAKLISLHQVALRLSKQMLPSACRQHGILSATILRTPSQSRSFGTRTFVPSGKNAKTGPYRSYQLTLHRFKLLQSGCLRRFSASEGLQKPSGFFPEESTKAVAYWLLGSAASVFGIVVFGGLTRLTESGLSITEWRPVTGSLPPMANEEWQSEFDKYRSSPEFKILNPNMTLSEFKKIYYMEWTHRLWGRFVGLSFVLPAVYFIARRRVTKSMALKIAGIGSLIGFQGLLGWWMVKSGLKDDLFAPGSHPRVSQYRLVAHLGTAFFCYSAMLWNGMQILRERKLLRDPEGAQILLSHLRQPNLKFFKTSVGLLAALVFVTAMSGGFVAGLDAGLIYNDFPWMGERWTPPKSELLSNFYSTRDDRSDLWWRNALENPSLAQLDHRILAISTFSAIVAFFTYSRTRSIAKVLPIGSRKAMHGVLGFACLQVTLGISTLIYLVPLPLASAHQAGSLALLSYVLVLANRSWLPTRRFLRLFQYRLINRVPNAKPDFQQFSGSISSKRPTRIAVQSS